MGYTINPQGLGKVSLNETDTVASVLQNVALILATPQGTVPLYRGFGIRGRFIDKPPHVARAMMIAEVEEAIRKYEPRASVVGVTFQTDENNPGRMFPIVEVEINEGP